eukprot:6902423-Karenia_brevis.AAC.1
MLTMCTVVTCTKKAAQLSNMSSSDSAWHMRGMRIKNLLQMQTAVLAMLCSHLLRRMLSRTIVSTL